MSPNQSVLSKAAASIAAHIEHLATSTPSVDRVGPALRAIMIAAKNNPQFLPAVETVISVALQSTLREIRNAQPESLEVTPDVRQNPAMNEAETFVMHDNPNHFINQEFQAMVSIALCHND
jgi:hypothetical protein